jgi:hypothetical protein
MGNHSKAVNLFVLIFFKKIEKKVGWVADLKKQ